MCPLVAAGIPASPRDARRALGVCDRVNFSKSRLIPKYNYDPKMVAAGFSLRKQRNLKVAATNPFDTLIWNFSAGHR
jgi:hypothetical protein